MRRRRGIARLCVALALLVALVTATSVTAKAPRSFFGVVPQQALTTEDLDRMGEAKVGTLRFEIHWAGIDPGPESGDLQWATVDEIVAGAARNGVDALPYIFSSPKWVADLDGRTCAAPDCPPFAPHSREALDAFQAFAKDAATRYGPDGQFWASNPDLPENPIRAWQLWNEQNSPSFYKPKPNVKKFAKLLEAGHEGITSVDPQAEIILGGMFGTPRQGRKPAIAAWDFLRKLYDVQGVKKHFDGIAPHPYAAQLSKVVAQIDLLRDEIKRGRDNNVDLWITELGWASGGPANPLNRGNRGQADRLTETFELFTKKRNAWNIRNVDWYSWRDNSDADVGLCKWCPFSGLLTEDHGEKKSFDAFTKFTGGS